MKILNENRIIHNSVYLLLNEKTKTNTEKLKICFLFTYIVGLIAHGYGFLNLTVSHDSLIEFKLYNSAPWKIIIGRFLEPVIRFFTGEIIVIPWLSGIISLFFICLSVFLISCIFSLHRRWEIIFLSSIFTTNITIIAMISTYIHDLSGDMFALLMSVCAVYVWRKTKKTFRIKYILLGSLCLFVSFGLYQAFFQVSITLVFICVIYDILNKESYKSAIINLLKFMLIGVIAVIAYILCAYFFSKIFGLDLGGDSGNDITRVLESPFRFVKMIGQCYYYVISYFIIPNMTTSQAIYTPVAVFICICNIVLIFYTVSTIFNIYKSHRIEIKEKIFVLLLLILLPVSMSCIMIISTASHHLTRYSFCLAYLLIIVVHDIGGKKVSRSIIIMLILSIISISNIQMSNNAYIKKEIERQATLSTMTRVVALLESYEGYVFGESTVAIIGKVDSQIKIDVGAVDGITGLGENEQIVAVTPDKYSNYLSSERYYNYLETMLHYPVEMCSKSEQIEIYKTEEFKNMTAFPDKGCIQTINDIVVVKMSE